MCRSASTFVFMGESSRARPEPFDYKKKDRTHSRWVRSFFRREDVLFFQRLEVGHHFGMVGQEGGEARCKSHGEGGASTGEADVEQAGRLGAVVGIAA